MIDTRTAPYAAFLLRVALGLMFFSHGFIMKVMGFGIAGTVGFFGSLGLPAIIAYLTILFEVGGGLFLILGIATRPLAAIGALILAGAWITVHASNGWMIGNSGGGWEYVGFLTVTSIAVALLGSGAFALGNKFLPGNKFIAG